MMLLFRLHGSLFILIASILISFGWLWLFSETRNSSDPGRGGAISVALSFAYLFLNRGTGPAIFKMVAKDAPQLKKNFGSSPASQAEHVTNLQSELDNLIDQLVNYQERVERDNAEQNKYLAASSVIGTLVWGFGDVMVAFLK